MSIAQTISFIWNHPLSRGRRAANRSRFARWQVKSRVFKGPHVEPFLGGARLSVRRGQTGATGNLYVGLHELEDMAFALHALAAGGCPLLAKIDVEGYETQVLAGAGESLATPALRGLILELNGSGERYGQYRILRAGRLREGPQKRQGTPATGVSYRSVSRCKRWSIWSVSSGASMAKRSDRIRWREMARQCSTRA